VKSPYIKLDGRAYWRSGVVDRHALDMGDIYRKKFPIRPGERIATAGSCFAQHIANRLRTSGYHVLDVEPPPPGLDLGIAQNFGFKLYSARYGNVYTLRQMLQLVLECNGTRVPAEIVWEKDGRYYDALRPSVEPEGLASPALVLTHRAQHLARVKQLLEKTSLFIFTMGLTETWEHVTDGTVYPTAPGTIAGSYDPAVYKFKNLTYTENLDDFLQLRELLRAYNPQMRFIVTVSPVPLTATGSGEHVLPATIYSKSVLRSVAGYLLQTFPDIDYFPSYEIVAGSPARGLFYENNLRSVSPAGVDVVMRSFFNQHEKVEPAAPARPKPDATDEMTGESEDAAFLAAQKVFCDEELLEAFAAK
jgi:hypothetical protein